MDVANNGEEAYYKFRKHNGGILQEEKPKEGEEGRVYSFVLMDIQMPVMDGLQSTELIRQFELEVITSV